MGITQLCNPKEINSSSNELYYIVIYIILHKALKGAIFYMRQYGPPTSPPPVVIPPKPSYSYIIDCLYYYTYVWIKTGQQFWFYPTRVEYSEVSGYRWTGGSWIFYRFNPSLIDEVACPVPTLY